MHTHKNKRELGCRWAAVSEFKDCGRVIRAEIASVSIVKTGILVYSNSTNGSSTNNTRSTG